MTRKVFATFAILIFSYPSLSAADIAARTLTPPGVISLSVSTDNPVKVSMEANKSYACALEQITPSNDIYVELESKAQVGSGQLDGRYIGNLTPVAAATSPDHRNESRLSLIPTESGEHTITILFGPEGETTSTSCRFSCLETTLYGSFNTVLNEYNFLELTNTANSTINVKIRVVGSDGTVLVDNSPKTLGAGIRTDFDLHSLVGAGDYGSVVVMHDGPFGAVKGAVSQYKVQADGSFLPTQSLPLEPRTNVSMTAFASNPE